MQGLRFLNDPKHCTFASILSRYPVFDKVYKVLAYS